MGKQLHVTLGSGDTFVADLQPNSMLIIRTRKPTDLGVVEDVEQAWSDIDTVEVVDTVEPDKTGPVVVQESPHLGTVESAVAAAQSMPVGDAAALLEQAQTKFGDSPAIADAQAQVAAQLQAQTATAAPADEAPAETTAAADETVTSDPPTAASSDSSETSSSTDSTSSDTTTGEAATDTPAA